MKILLVAGAVLLSAFDGVLNALSVLVFTADERDSLLVGVHLPLLLWICALVYWKFPRGGLFSYFLVIVASVILQAGPFRFPNEAWFAWHTVLDNLPRAILGGGFLMLDFFLQKYESAYNGG